MTAEGRVLRATCNARGEDGRESVASNYSDLNLRPTHFRMLPSHENENMDILILLFALLNNTVKSVRY